MEKNQLDRANEIIGFIGKLEGWKDQIKHAESVTFKSNDKNALALKAMPIRDNTPEEMIDTILDVEKDTLSKEFLFAINSFSENLLSVIDKCIESLKDEFKAL